jgi:ferrochelatase
MEGKKKLKLGKKGVLIVNLGTPDSPNTPDVRKYLREFLMDGRVIDIPFIPRWLLVNGIITTFRAPKSAKEYQKLWDERGSPLKYYGEDIRDLLQEALGTEYVVELGMRYQSPSIADALSRLQKKCVDEIILIPLFPQYASATSGSVIDKVFEITRNWQIIPGIKVISRFADNPLFIEAFAKIGRKYLDSHSYDHVLFSYHGLPERQIKKGSTGDQCQLGDCCNTYHLRNAYCYRAQCFLTTRLLVEKLGLQEGGYTTCFQSRLGKDPWVQPYTEDMIKKMIADGHKRVLVFSPAFIADCLETTVEIGEAYKEQFEEMGGEHWELVHSLNDDPNWVECLKQMVLELA